MILFKNRVAREVEYHVIIQKAVLRKRVLEREEEDIFDGDEGVDEADVCSDSGLVSDDGDEEASVIS
jgi:hypothetical protein